MSSDNRAADSAETGDAPVAQLLPVATPGEVLREHRERRALSVQQVADALHLTMHYVRALESDAYDKLPGEVFARGYIRSYARLLEIDPESVLGLYQQLGERRQARKQEAKKRYARRRMDRNRPWVIVSGIAFVALAVVLWYFNVGVTEPVQTPVVDQSGPDETDPVPGAPSGAANLLQSGASVVSADEMPAVAQRADEALLSGGVAGAPETDGGLRVVELNWGGEDRLSITVNAESWIEVDDRRDEEHFREMLVVGDQLRITGTAPFSVLLGNARQIELSFNGRVVDVSANVRNDDSARLTLGM